MPERSSGVILLANASGFEQQSQVLEMAKDVVSLLDDKHPVPFSLPISSRFRYWVFVLTPLLQVLGIVLVWRKRQGIKGWGIILTVILNVAVVLLPSTAAGRRIARQNAP